MITVTQVITCKRTENCDTCEYGGSNHTCEIYEKIAQERFCGQDMLGLMDYQLAPQKVLHELMIALIKTGTPQ